MRFRTEAGKADAVNITNFVSRGLQFLVGLTVVVLYAIQKSYDRWIISYGDSLEFNLGIAAGAMALLTTPFLGLLPFFIGYRPVAFACLWDLIVMAVYAGAFAYYKKRFPYGTEGDLLKTYLHNTFKINNSRIDVMSAAVTIDLIGMLLWIITLLMAVGLLAFGRVRGSKKY